MPLAAVPLAAVPLAAVPLAAVPPAAERARAVEVLDLLEEAYPGTRLALDYRTPLELLIALILAAQNTDENINRVSPGLFAKYPSAHAWAAAPLDALQEDLRPTGFFNQKARSVKEACTRLVAEHGGRVPDDLEALLRLRGVGRKTANILQGNAFGHPDRVGVDTHVGRLARRLGFSTHDDPDRVEGDLVALWPAERRTRACVLLQAHGRAVCRARKAECDRCPVAPLCPSAGIA